MERLMTSSPSTDNLQQELAVGCASDGLSDKENVVQQMKRHVKYLPDRLTAVSSVGNACNSAAVQSNEASLCFRYVN
jgi:hypothetical protein